MKILMLPDKDWEELPRGEQTLWIVLWYMQFLAAIGVIALWLIATAGL